jgi:hypothetical protein
MYDPAVVEAFAVLEPLPQTLEEQSIQSDFKPLRQRLGEPPPTTTTMQSPRPELASHNRRTKVAQFTASLAGRGWESAAMSLPAFLADVLPDSKSALFRLAPSGGILVLVEPDSADGRLPAAVNLGQGVTGWVGANRRAMVNADAELDIGEAARLTMPPLRLCVSVPVIQAESLVGVLTVYSSYAFNEVDQLLIENLAKNLPPAREAERSRAVLTATSPENCLAASSA